MNVLLVILAILALSSVSAFALESSFSSASESSSSNSESGSETGNESGSSELTSQPRRLSAREIGFIASRAGFEGSDLATAVAVALAESGGDVQAYNPEPQKNTPDGLGSVGLWQIYLAAHPEFQGEDLNDPQTNGDAAFQVYLNAGRSFRPWSTFKNGAYLAHLGKAQAAVSA